MDQHIFLSPHPDDVVLSCGGILYHLIQRGEKVQVINIFAGMPPSRMSFSKFAEYQHRQWGYHPQEAYRRRRQEDQKALQILGGQPLYLNFLDCIYRGQPEKEDWYYLSDDDIFGSVHPQELNLIPEIIQAIEDRLAQTQGSAPLKIYAPLTLGQHVDHQLTFLAAQHWQKTRAYSVYFYEDYPYVQRNLAELDRVLDLNRDSWQAEIITFSKHTLSLKMQAIAAYTSQMDILFGGEVEMRRLVQAQAYQVGQAHPSERLWYETI